MNTELRFIPVGYGNSVCANKIVCVLKLKGVATQRRFKEAKSKNQVIDLTQGRATRSLLLMDNGRLIEVALKPQTVLSRLNAKDEMLNEAARIDEETEENDEVDAE